MPRTFRRALVCLLALAVFAQSTVFGWHGAALASHTGQASAAASMGATAVVICRGGALETIWIDQNGEPIDSDAPVVPHAACVICLTAANSEHDDDLLSPGDRQSDPVHVSSHTPTFAYVDRSEIAAIGLVVGNRGPPVFGV
ncbi:MAG: hypothetical protein AAFY64_01915 [Pseudomonadota bacterium]